MRKTDLLAIERAIADAMGDIARLNCELNESEAEIAKFRQEAVIAVNSNKQAALDAFKHAGCLAHLFAHTVQIGFGGIERIE
ncbi:hypothetical protein ACC698_38440, partial [Rhizobium johnstonii]